MGLDMYIYRAKKINLPDSKVYDEEEIVKSLNEAFVGSDPLKPMESQLMPYCSKLRVQNRWIDFEKIKENFNMSDPDLCGFWDGEYHFSDTGDACNHDVSISPDIMCERYSFVKEEIKYVCELEEVGYWRKAYDVRNWIRENLDCKVENCGFYHLNKKFIQDFNKQFPDDHTFENLDSEDLFYYEWY